MNAAKKEYNIIISNHVNKEGLYMKKFSLIIIFLLILAVSANSAVIISVRLGYLTKLNTTEENFKSIIESSNNTNDWSIFKPHHEIFGVKFYDSLQIMQMALNANEIDEMALPEMTAIYLTNINPDYVICCASRSHNPMSLAFGFRKDILSQALAKNFNNAIKSMEDDFTLATLQGEYINSSAEYKPVKIPKFPGKETIKIAVTGDMPPIDYIAPDGEPAGFNTALLAEIAKRLEINIEILQINSGSRTAALISGRADVIFWYETSKNFAYNADAPEDIILSEPYYNWNTFLHVNLKHSR